MNCAAAGASGITEIRHAACEPHVVELCAFLGLDWIMIDMMLTGMDFRDVQNMIRTSEAAGITPVVRAHSDPWLGYDHRIIDGADADKFMVAVRSYLENWNEEIG